MPPIRYLYRLINRVCFEISALGCKIINIFYSTINNFNTIWFNIVRLKIKMTLNEAIPCGRC